MNNLNFYGEHVLLEVSHWHEVVGLLIVAAMLIRRKDHVLRLFGQAVAGLATFRLVWAVASSIGVERTIWSDDSRVMWGLLFAIPMSVAILLALRVGSDEGTPLARALIVAGGLAVIVIAAAVRFIDGPFEGQFGAAHPVSTIIVTFLFASSFIIALHTVLAHTNGAGYRILFESAFAVLIIGVSVEFVVVAAGTYPSGGHTDSSEALRVAADVITSVTALILWVSVAIHELAEIGRERKEQEAA